MGGKLRTPEELWTLFIDGAKRRDGEKWELDADMFEMIKKQHGIN